MKLYVVGPSSLAKPKWGTIRYLDFLKHLVRNQTEVIWFHPQRNIQISSITPGLKQFGINSRFYNTLKDGFLGRLIASFIISISLFRELKLNVTRNPIILFYGPRLICVIPFLLCKIFRVRTVLDLMEEDSPNFINVLILKFFLKLACEVITITRTLSDLVTYYSPRKKTTVIPHPFFSSLGDGWTKARSPSVSDETILANSRKRVFGYFGSIKQHQGLLDLIRAFKKMESKNLELIICGRTPPGSKDLEKELRHEINQYSNIIWIGPLDSTVLMNQYRARCEFLVLPKENNRFNHFCFPTKLIEYLGTGRVTIASKVGISGRILTDLQNAILFEGSNIISLRNALNRALELTTEQILKISQNGVALIRSEFDSETICNLFQQTLEQASC